MRACFLVIVCLLICPIVARAEVGPRLPAVFTDHMVLQRDRPVPVWGWSNPDEEVSVEFAGQKKTARSDANGRWMVRLDPLPASAEPRDLVVECAASQLKSKIADVLVGDIWLCSGQSNMGMSVSESADAAREIDAATFPSIRLFSVEQHPTLTPATDVKGKWGVCSPETVARFSATAYYFGRTLHRELNIPIGLLHSSVGGTQAEAWMRLDVLRTVPALAERADKEIAQITSQEHDSRTFLGARAAWEERYGVTPPPVADTARDWADPSLDTSDWATITLAKQWAQHGAKSGGVFWIRKEVTLPETAAGKPFSLSLNWISEQYDTAYFNGVEIGRANDKPPTFYNVQRRYTVPGGLVKAGRNVIAVRIVSATQFAGVWQWGHMLDLPVADRDAIDDEWRMKTESTFAPLPADALAARPKPNTIAFRNVSSSLYNGMIAPLVPFAIKGVIWYQGENNAGRAAEYRDVMTLLISDWRGQWGQGDFPFIIQQLVNNGRAVVDANVPGGWPLLREAQDQTASTVPQCGIAVGIELGSATTIHPPNKQDVGRRLALVAFEKVYGTNVESSGPRYESMTIEAATVRVRFSHATGLVAKEGPPRRFAIAGEDRKFVWADARIDGDTVVVSSPQVPEPLAVRYAWADNPQGCNCFNAAGLPMAPFRTDDWK